MKSEVHTELAVESCLRHVKRKLIITLYCSVQAELVYVQKTIY